jgi:hypothetical protein
LDVCRSHFGFQYYTDFFYRNQFGCPSNFTVLLQDNNYCNCWIYVVSTSQYLKKCIIVSTSVRFIFIILFVFSHSYVINICNVGEVQELQMALWDGVADCHKQSSSLRVVNLSMFVISTVNLNRNKSSDF